MTDRKRRIHEDDLVEIAEWESIEAASRERRKQMAADIEQIRSENFGFLTPRENERIKQTVRTLEGS